MRSSGVENSAQPGVFVWSKHISACSRSRNRRKGTQLFSWCPHRCLDWKWSCFLGCTITVLLSIRCVRHRIISGKTKCLYPCVQACLEQLNYKRFAGFVLGWFPRHHVLKFYPKKLCLASHRLRYKYSLDILRLRHNVELHPKNCIPATHFPTFRLRTCMSWAKTSSTAC